MDLKAKAVECAAWAKQRADVMTESGVPVPEPIRRLLELSDAMAVAPATDSGVHANTLDMGVRKILGAADAELTTNAAERVMRDRDAARAEAERALTDAASVLLGVAKAVKGGVPAGVHVITTDAKPVERPRALVALRSGIVLRNAAGAEVCLREKSGAWTASWRKSGSATWADGVGATPDQWYADTWTEVKEDATPYVLAHGMVLENKVTPGHRVLISEPVQGRFVAQTVHATGDLLPPHPTEQGEAWSRARWTEVGSIGQKGPAHWSAAVSVAGGDVAPVAPPATRTQTVIPGTVPETPAGPTVAKIADWTPDAVYIAQAVQSLAAKCPTAGVTEASIRSLVDRFKREKGDVAAPKPATTFHHWAVRTLNGGGK